MKRAKQRARDYMFYDSLQQIFFNCMKIVLNFLQGFTKILQGSQNVL